MLFAFLLIISALMMPTAASGARNRPTLLVGGIPFGVRFVTDGILVVGYSDVRSGGKAKNPAREAGLKPGDCIYQINELRPHTASELATAIEENGKGELTLRYHREGKEGVAVLRPVPCDEDGRLRTGLFVRDSGAGIGTVTFVDPATNAFAGLGHGICDGECGTLIPMARGSVMGVTIGNLKKGAPGAPGELKGHFSAGKTGSLFSNTVCGVYGVFAERPCLPAGAMEIGFHDELHDGAATLWCTLDDNCPREYGIEISDIHRAAKGNKCFTVTVTDAALLDRTGGIIQGMSGSPIIQDGRLVGAVTHVLIGDPTTGYGIFIENMLANIPAALS